MARGTILIVDDQQGIRESMAGILELEGFEVFSCEDGAKGLARAKEVKFDLAFLDVKMPGMSGIDVFRELHKLQPETVVYMMTAFDEDDLVKELINEGACDCIDKPFNMDQVLSIVDKYFARPA